MQAERCSKSELVERLSESQRASGTLARPAEDASGWLGLHSDFEPCSGASARCFHRYMLERYNSFLRQQNDSSPPSVADPLLLSLSFTTNTSLALTATTQSLSESFKEIYHKDQDFPNKK